MARRIADVVPSASELELPPELAVFTFEAWTRPEDKTGPTYDAHGALAEFIAADRRWQAALYTWGRSHRLDRQEVRDLVTRRPQWPQDYLEA